MSLPSARRPPPSGASLLSRGAACSYLALCIEGCACCCNSAPLAPAPGLPCPAPSSSALRPTAKAAAQGISGRNHRNLLLLCLKQGQPFVSRIRGRHVCCRRARSSLPASRLLMFVESHLLKETCYTEGHPACHLRCKPASPRQSHSPAKH